MSESTFTKSIQFWIDPVGIMQVAEIMEKSEFANCIVGTDDDAVVIEVDYDPRDLAQVQHISDLQNAEEVLHYEFIN
ncbi:MAG: hypothetical protein JNM41_03860 [Flavipsychrobacter sp.]|nr:hypothetical protein [Flavipsychrobacter sp.]